MDANVKKPELQKAPLPANEAERLAALKALHLFDSGSEVMLDEITSLAAVLCETPAAMISLVDEKREWFKSKVGVNLSEVDREISFCGHAIFEAKTLVVEDTLLDSRFAGNPLVRDTPHIRFYLGAPLVTTDGFILGTLCVFDQRPRKLSPQQIRSLETLSRQVVLRFESKNLERELRAQKDFFYNIVNTIPEMVAYIDLNHNYLFRNQAYKTWFKLTDEDLKRIRSVQQGLGEKAYALAKPHVELALSGVTHTYDETFELVLGGVPATKTLRATLIPDFREDGKVAGLYTVVSDLTDNLAREKTATQQARLLEQALSKARSSESVFRSYFHNSFAPCFSVVVRSVNKQKGGVKRVTHGNKSTIQSRV